MFGDRHACGRANQRDRGRNVEGVQPIAAGAADIEDFVGGAPLRIDRRQNGFGAQIPGERGDLGDRLPFAGQFRQEIGLELRGDTFSQQLLAGQSDLLFG
jgi:hypothetical protein